MGAAVAVTRSELTPAQLRAAACASEEPAQIRRLNVWEFLRGNKLSALVWDNYDAIVDACVGAWHFLIGDPERIRSIGSRSWACVSR